MTTTETVWLAIGLIGQVCFFMRFFVQWISSERQKRSVIPVAFWYFSLGGAAILLTYAVHRQDPVFILGQSMGFLIYTRNLVLLGKEKREKAAG
ncbi:MAG: lipid A biosynthesis acyltransferase [bacterium]|nr:lipid A biosynthesis acyltransferase [bacterium]